jgi:hypothetical protein
MSIVDCELCNRLLQKVYANIKRGQAEPPEVAQLVTVFQEDSQAHEYAFTQTALKVCPSCGAYYYYRYDRDEGEHFMDPTNEDVSLERWSPAWVMDFLTGKNTPEAREIIRTLEARYPDLIRDYVAHIAPQPPQNWQVVKHLIETLTDEYLLQLDWEGLEILLLRHANPVVRVETAVDLVYIATEQHPVWNCRHFTKALAGAAQDWLFHRQREQFLVDVFVNVLQTPRAETQVYDWFFGYRQSHTHSRAISGLANAAYRQIDIRRAIPALVRLFSGDEWLNKRICEALSHAIEQQGTPAKTLIREELNAAGIDPTLRAIQDVLKTRKQRKHKEGLGNSAR